MIYPFRKKREKQKTIMETNCLLELSLEEGSGILGEVRLKHSTTDGTENDVSSMLLENSTDNHGNASYSTTGMDFEFVNSDLGSGSTYSMDHSSVFDIAEPIIDEKSELFRDAAVFDDQNDVEKLPGLSLDVQTRKKLIMDLGLKLQIIPLNNLKLVSTIQTSEGVHIVALPDDSTISQSLVVDQPLIRDILPHLGAGKVFPSSNDAVRSSSLSAEYLDKTDRLKIVELESPTLCQNEDISFDQSTITSATESVPVSTHEANMMSMSMSSPAGPTMLQLLTTQTQGLNSAAKVKQLTNPIQPSSMYAFIENLTVQGNNMPSNEQASTGTLGNKISPRPIFKESKIVIDLRKLRPQKKSRQMVSLLNSPKTNKLFGRKQNNTLVDKKIISNDKKSKNVSILGNFQTTRFLTKQALAKSHKVFEGKITNVKKNCRPKLQKDKKNASTEQVKKAIKKSKASKGATETNQCGQCKVKFIRSGNYKNHLILHETYDKLEEKLVENNLDKQSNKGNENKYIPVLNVTEDETIDNTYQSENLKVSEQTDKHTTVIDKCTSLEQECPDMNVQLQDQTEHIDVEMKTGADKADLKCHVCQLLFSSKGNLTRHKLIHMKTIGRYLCTGCDKSFHQQCDLTRHERVHSGQLPFSCLQCQKGFLRKSDLTGHEKFHSKVKTHKCSKCSKSYYQSGDLQRHIRQIHEDSCQFPCLYCSKRYTAQRSLFTHVRSKHMQQGSTVIQKA